MAGSRRRWRRSEKFSRLFSDARRAPLRRRAVRPQRATHRWLDAAHQAASNHLRGVFGRPRHADQSGLQGVHLAHRALSVGMSQHQHAEDASPARRFRSAKRARISITYLHTPIPPRRSESHGTHVDCTVLKSRSTCRQIHHGMICRSTS